MSDALHEASPEAIEILCALLSKKSETSWIQIEEGSKISGGATETGACTGERRDQADGICTPLTLVAYLLHNVGGGQTCNN